MTKEIINEEIVLTEQDVQNIRAMADGGTNKSYLATKYNCEIGHINYICARDVKKDKLNWDDLNGESNATKK